MADKLNVKGVAIKAGLSRNNVRYDAEELAKFALTLNGVSIIKDHNAVCDSAIGLVTKTSFDPMTNSVMYSGWITDDGTGITERVKDGRVSKCSIGAIAGKIVEDLEDSNIVIAQDLVGVELSTVIVPGVPGASITQSLDSINANKINNTIKVKPIIESFDLRLTKEQADGMEDKVVSEEEVIVSQEDITAITEEVKSGALKEMMNSSKTSPDEMDKHIHEAMFDDNGDGETDDMHGDMLPMHKHIIQEFMVKEILCGDKKSIHSEKLIWDKKVVAEEAVKSEDENAVVVVSTVAEENVSVENVIETKKEESCSTLDNKVSEEIKMVEEEKQATVVENTNDKLLETLANVTKGLEAVNSRLSNLEKVSESKKEVVETKSVVENKSSDANWDGFCVESQGDGKFAMFKMPTADGRLR